MADPHPDAVGLVGAVDQVPGHVELKYIASQWIVRSGRHDAGQGIAQRLMFASYRGWNPPVRVARLANDCRFSKRRLPANPANAHGIGDDGRRTVGVDRRVKKQALAGDVQYQPLARRIGQDELSRQQDGLAVTGEPGIHLRVSGDDLVISKAIVARDLRQGVGLSRVDNLRHPDYPLRRALQHKYVGFDRFGANRLHGKEPGRRRIGAGSNAPIVGHSATGGQ